MFRARNWALVILGSCFLFSAAPAAAANCEGWNTEDFFESATLKAVTDCLQAGAKVNARAENGFTPLHIAAGFSKTPAVVKALLAAGAKVNARTEKGCGRTKIIANQDKNNCEQPGNSAVFPG